MRIQLARFALPFAFVALSAGIPARADIYTWVDAKGRVNVSNLTPPEGARITSVVQEDADAAARVEAARQAAHAKELQALSERVQQLEQDLAAARVPPPPPYAALPPPPSNPVVIAAPVVQLTVSAASPQGYGCDPTFDCGYGWPAFFYPGVTFVSGPPARRSPPFFRTHQAPWAPLQPIVAPIVQGPPAPMAPGPRMIRRS